MTSAAPHSRLMVRTGSPIALSLTLLLRLDTGGVNVIGHPDLSIVDRAIDDEFACLAAAVGRLQWAVTHAETEAVVAAARGRLARPPVGRLTRRTDRFRCPWLHSVLTAGTCVARQDAVHEGGRNDRTRPRATPTHPACVACAQVTGEGTAATAPTESPATDGRLGALYEGGVLVDRLAADRTELRYRVLVTTPSKTP